MLTDERYKELMAGTTVPNSLSMLQCLKQAVMEAELQERERCAGIAEKHEPDEKQDYIQYASREIRGIPVKARKQ